MLVSRIIPPGLSLLRNLKCSSCHRNLLHARQNGSSATFTNKNDVDFRLPYEPNLAEDLPEHVYEGKNHRKSTRVYCWGVASQGALGRPSFHKPKASKKQKFIEEKIVPHRIGFGQQHRVIDAACGYGFTLFAVKDKDKISCYGTGLNTDSQIGLQTDRGGVRYSIITEPKPIPIPLENKEFVTKVSGGRAHSLVLTNKGNAFSLGNNAYGQCGRRMIPDEDYSRTAIYTKLQGVEGGVSQIETGQDNSFLVSAEGTVYSCGWGADGQTGRGHYGNEDKLGPLKGDLEGTNIVKVSCRADCALALSDRGDVFGWGNNEYQQLSLCCDEPQLHTPRRLPLPSYVGRVVDVACGGTACFIINDAGEVYSWGYGPLGRGPANVFSQLPEIIPPPLLGTNELNADNKVQSVTCGVHMTMCLTTSGDLYSWGKNRGGCLGLGHLKHQLIPTNIALLCPAVKVSCGVDHAVALAKAL